MLDRYCSHRIPTRMIPEWTHDVPVPIIMVSEVEPQLYCFHCHGERSRTTIIPFPLSWWAESTHGCKFLHFPMKSVRHKELKISGPITQFSLYSTVKLSYPWQWLPTNFWRGRVPICMSMGHLVCLRVKFFAAEDIPILTYIRWVK